MSHFQDLIKSCGLRCTHQRELVLQTITQTDHPCTVEYVVSVLHRSSPVHRATVYRDIQHFVNHGLLTELSILGSSALYYESATLPHHHHFVCTVCQSIEDLQDEKLEDAIRSVAVKMNHAGQKVTHHQFKLYGVCLSCSRNHE